MAPSGLWNGLPFESSPSVPLQELEREGLTEPVRRV